MARQQKTTVRNWYAIHTYAGYEQAVVRNLKQRVESLGMEEKIFDAIVPTEKKVKRLNRVLSPSQLSRLLHTAKYINRLPARRRPLSSLSRYADSTCVAFIRRL